MDHLMTTKAARRICDFQLDIPHRPALMEKQLTIDKDTIKDNEDILEGQENDSDFLNLTSSPLSSHEPYNEDSKEWIDKHKVKDRNSDYSQLDSTSTVEEEH